MSLKKYICRVIINKSYFELLKQRHIEVYFRNMYAAKSLRLNKDKKVSKQGSKTLNKQASKVIKQESAESLDKYASLEKPEKVYDPNIQNHNQNEEPNQDIKQE